MDGVNGVASSAASAANNDSNALTNAATNSLNKDDFMKLFLTSLQYQDPSSPLDTNQMMSQMSQLAMMEQVSNMSSAVNKLSDQAQSSAMQSAVGFIGKSIKGVNLNGDVVSGLVESIQQTTNGVMLKLKDNDTVVPLTYITEVNN
ncbi:flagellar hook capping FlgD N-terminal domain-containing protein [Listeria grayi]|uniref:flagellar hook capping FlgD N-terminal domain-containing protein n=1 Tax=Listeria grayi TaxID=1641 RepID=UPI00162732DA|nr:flagellar hook capping FlgD N-terminal domain-containing protein [Listeria grayi]MBC1921260.1 flagellar basal body rod modification protein [Listeria grayi]